MRFKSLMTFTYAALIVAGLSSTAHAQTSVIPGDKLAWDQQAADLATAQAATYKLYADGAATGTVLTPVTCADQTPVLAGNFTCSTPFPAFTPTVLHSVKVTAGNAAGESLQSTPFSFRFVVVPSVPTNLRRIP